ncbi:MAG: hypothetical protein HYX32_03370 [Actinobacteria bacterium]|nr:hypothetical protein [Actinomycetota bacterium]
MRWPVLERSSLDAIAALVTRALPDEVLTAGELDGSLFADDPTGHRARRPRRRDRRGGEGGRRR